jgi:cell division initiation protein
LEQPLASSTTSLERVEFATAIRGYDKDEVDTFLRELAAEHNRMMAELAAAQQGAEKVYLEMGEEIGDILQHAKDVADQMKKQAEEESARRADELRTAAEVSALKQIRDAQEKVRQLKAAEQEVRARLQTIADTIHSLSIRIADIDSTAEIDATTRDDASEIAALTREVTTSPTPSPA